MLFNKFVYSRILYVKRSGGGNSEEHFKKIIRTWEKERQKGLTWFKQLFSQDWFKDIASMAKFIRWWPRSHIATGFTNRNGTVFYKYPVILLRREDIEEKQHYKFFCVQIIVPGSKSLPKLIKGEIYLQELKVLTRKRCGPDMWFLVPFMGMWISPAIATMYPYEDWWNNYHAQVKKETSITRIKELCRIERKGLENAVLELEKLFVENGFSVRRPRLEEIQRAVKSVKPDFYSEKLSVPSESRMPVRI